MRIILIAAGGFAIPALDSLHRSEHEIPFVITQPDRPSGRGKRLTPTPVNRAANDFGLEVVTAPNVNDPAVIESVSAAGADVGVVIDFGQRVGPEFRASIRGGCVNLHASLLPKYRGAAPFQWAVIRGERVTGVTVFTLVDRMDAGPILASAETAIGDSETADELHDRLAKMGPSVVADAIKLFECNQIPRGATQDDTRATKAPKLAKRDGMLDFAAPAAGIVHRIHGLWSWPGAYCRFMSADGLRDEVVTLARAAVSTAPSAPLDPGSLDERLHVCTIDGAVEIVEIKPRSGKLMSWRDFINGRRVKCGDRFVPS